MKEPIQYASKRSELLSFIPREAKRLLDVGCSSGNFGATLKAEREVEIWGVEPNKAAADEAETKVNRVVNAPFCDGIAVPDKYFDVVAFLDSLEHFPAPEPALRLAKKKINDSGIVIASIPNVHEHVHDVAAGKRPAQHPDHGADAARFVGWRPGGDHENVQMLSPHRAVLVPMQALSQYAAPSRRCHNIRDSSAADRPLKRLLDRRPNKWFTSP